MTMVKEPDTYVNGQKRHVFQRATCCAVVVLHRSYEWADVKSMIMENSDVLSVKKLCISQNGSQTTFVFNASYEAVGANRTDINRRLKRIFGKRFLKSVSRAEVFKYA